LHDFAQKTLVVQQLAGMNLSAVAIDLIEQLSLLDYSDVLQDDISLDECKIQLEQTKKLFDSVIEILLKDFPKTKEQRDLLRTEMQKRLQQDQ